MTLNSKLSEISKKMNEKAIRGSLKVDSRGSLFNKHECLQILVEKVSDEITTSADIQRILRDVVGYGTVSVEYHDKGQLLLVEYTPLKKGDVSATEFRKMHNVPVPGSTGYNR